MSVALHSRLEEAPNSVPESETSPELSIVMPCLNEAETLEICINKAQGALRRARYRRGNRNS